MAMMQGAGRGTEVHGLPFHPNPRPIMDRGSCWSQGIHERGCFREVISCVPSINSLYFLDFSNFTLLDWIEC